MYCVLEPVPKKILHRSQQCGSSWPALVTSETAEVVYYERPDFVTVFREDLNFLTSGLGQIAMRCSFPGKVSIKKHQSIGYSGTFQYQRQQLQGVALKALHIFSLGKIAASLLKQIGIQFDSDHTFESPAAPHCGIAYIGASFDQNTCTASLSQGFYLPKL